ncbi:sugar phosphate isomerase/epimerase [Anaerocolumna sp. AGMB13025]|uniref:sugar phosphate isomerase/epimerase family protein n=1 Tax=Anaerocolumna sp. AGMB13025 TaxID=3039116 RepID=UPI00241E8477|nr:sugar phosphate isomerase/epimerase [Anaerocolumna sp. AGMB13025]WFR60262.1 sugar phosphate isomerase/epimerase [Anaerocolumna sp. AGMB13025]
MKISVSSYSFSKLLSSGIMTQLDCIKKAKELGFDAIEFVDILAPEGVSTKEYAKILSQECKRLELPISSFTFGADFLKGSGGNTQLEIERVKKMVDMAEILGAKLVRHDATTGDGRSFDAILPVIAAACKEVTIYAAAKGIKTTVENHGFFCQDSERVEKLYNAVGHENFGLLADMGNFLCADEAPDKAFGRIAPYTFYAHAKDFHVKSAMLPDPGEGFFRTRSGNYLRGAIIGHGDVPVLHCIKALKNVNYNGYIAIEFEGMEDTLQGITIGFNNLKQYVKEA